MMRKSIALLLLLASFCFASAQAFAEQNPLERLEQRAAEAAQRAATETLSPNEIEIILYRRRLMGKPGLQLYVVFFNDMGQPVDYFVTDGKCASSNKRLLPPWRFVRDRVGLNDKGESNYGHIVFPASDLDGTYGASDDYLFCKTADGKYKQWSGKYYASDSPIELTIKPMVIEVVRPGGVAKNQSQQ